MSLALSKTGAADVVDLLAPFARLQTLDGRTLAVTVAPSDAGLIVTCVPDLPKVTSVRFAAEGQGDGEPVTLSAARLVDMCRRSTDGLSLSCEDSVVDAGIWKTPELPRRDPPSNFEPAWEWDAKAFTKALLATRYAASTDPIRPRLCLVHFGMHHVRACDGLRYHEQRVESVMDWDVPVGSVSFIELVAGQSPTGRLLMSQGPAHQLYGVEGLEVAVPSPAASYLDLDEVVAAPARAHNHHVLRVDRTALQAAIRDVAIMAGETQAVRLDVRPVALTVSATDGGLNSGSVELPCEWAGEHRSLRFWTAPLLQLLGTSTRDLLELRLGMSTLKALTPLVVWEDDSFALLNQIRGS